MKRFLSTSTPNGSEDQSKSWLRRGAITLALLSAVWFGSDIKTKLFQSIRSPVSVEEKIARLNSEIAKLKKERESAIKEAEIKNLERGLALLKARPPVAAYEKQKVPLAPSPAELANPTPAEDAVQEAPASPQLKEEAEPARLAEETSPAPLPEIKADVPSIQFVKKGELATSFMNDSDDEEKKNEEQEVPTIQFFKKGPVASQIMQEQKASEDSQDSHNEGE